jgi:hypothetical protein
VASGAGVAVSLEVKALPSHDSDCVTHLFGGMAAYQSDCLSWSRAPRAVWFWVVVRNESGKTVAFDRSELVLRGNSGKTSSPIDLRSIASDPHDFLPSSGDLSAGGTLAGWLNFAPSSAWVPTRLEYRGKIPLEIQFKGAPSVNARQ